jgi:hypothetical protein
MKIKVLAWGGLGRARRPAPLKKKVFFQQPETLSELETRNDIFLAII